MTKEEQEDAEMKKFLHTRNGELVLSWIKRKSGFDLPVFDSDDTTGHVARLRDGGRQIVCELLNLKKS